MAHAQKPNLSSVERAIQRDLANIKKVPCQGNRITRTLSFEDWADTGPISDASPPSLIPLYKETTSPKVKTPSQDVKHPTSLAMPTNWTKNVGPSSCPKTPNSPYEVWVGTRRVSATNDSSSRLKTPVPIFETPTHDRATPPPRLDLIEPSDNIRRNYSGTKRKAPCSSNAIVSDMATKKVCVVDDFFCKSCQISCSGARTFKQHLVGRRHKAKLRWMREQRNDSGGSKVNTRCVVCKICCTDKIALEMHLKGKKHKAKLQELELGKSNGTGMNAKKILRCEVCMVHCVNEDSLKMHLMGKPHASRLRLKRGGLV
ncbi:hypothetical protein ACJIZ3_021282 [Penstemon smallii]|uniref:C2H2-type domain-containing protein n=1 Tax=Penstemon smallii TaxID=265156 RepID=A0ABD3SLZ0_9LAMI